MKVEELLSRARSVSGKGIRYKLGSGGIKASSMTPANNVNECDCSGYVAWCLGLSRMTDNPVYQKFNGGWINTDAIVNDANATVGIFERMDTPKAGCLIVYPSSKPTTAVGHVGIVTAVTQKGEVSKVIHCSSGNYRRTGDAVQETGPEVFKANKTTVYAWYAGME
ncbi:MAG TPA: CHAP domain-containing protein [Thermodesulfovibrionales bacterium]|nr:CHAP domain-containing protein [Thermodesulfovibrionales bacterium]